MKSAAATQMTVSPFTDNPDAPVFVETATHRQAVAQARFAIEQDGGLVVITGEAGVGKTAVLDRVAQLCSDGERLLLRLSATEIGDEGLEEAMLTELRRQDHGVDPDMSLEDALEYCRDDDVPVALMIDDAGDLGPEGLDALFRLVQLDDSGEPLVRIVIAGRASLRSLLYRDDMAGLRDCISSSITIQPLNAEETAEYFDTRVRGAGFAGEIVATPGFLLALAEVTSGNPAKINKAASRAIAAAGMAGRSELQAGDLDPAVDAEDIPDAEVVETLSANAVAAERETIESAEAETVADETPAEEMVSEGMGPEMKLSGSGNADPTFTANRQSTVTVKDLNAAIEMLSKPGARPGQPVTPPRPKSPQEMISEPSPLMQEAAKEEETTPEDVWEPAAAMTEEEAAEIDAADETIDDEAAKARAEAVRTFVDDVRNQIGGLRVTIESLRSEAERLDARRKAAREMISERIRTIETKLNDIRGE